MNLTQGFIPSARTEFQRYKDLGDRALSQLSDAQLFASPGPGSNSAAVIVQHLAGNMLSRWTRFLEEDGEKPWRNRESEFREPAQDRKVLMARWEAGWECLFEALDQLEGLPPETRLHIRGQAHSPEAAVTRQLAHYASHVGQLIYLGKWLLGESWQPLSIPPGQSEAFNRRMMGPRDQA
ncbi:DUF1572 family protein [Robiginitalea sp. M366]|uniref:DUF1572 family protein n=1 Tax=Robiginitalea aestuariiviva TaxID=3036903 RepID=UPI00240D4A1C|nr:DUF1572 family protein [Robiginitalea aestuariiviva]MDG1572585.1 DUF1572 family protein [Robiginitalea aestuariiviva]